MFLPSTSLKRGFRLAIVIIWKALLLTQICAIDPFIFGGIFGGDGAGNIKHRRNYPGFKLFHASLMIGELFDDKSGQSRR